MADLLVIAKAPVPGHSKTRLCPPCTPEQAAELAEAALADTLDAVARTPCERRILVLEGSSRGLRPDGFEVVPQCAGGLGERLAAAFAHSDGPALLIGMDTPQVRPALLGDALAQLARPDADAVLGLAEDGGYWAIGLRKPAPEAFAGVPMSSSRTGACQRRPAPAAGSQGPRAATAARRRLHRRRPQRRRRAASGPLRGCRPRPGAEPVPELTLPSATAVYELGLDQGRSASEPAHIHAVGDDGSRRRLPIERWLQRAPDDEEQLLRPRERAGARHRLRRRPPRRRAAAAAASRRSGWRSPTAPPRSPASAAPW